MSPRLFKEEAQREEKRIEMLEVGFTLLKQYGFAHMAVDKIASSVGIGKGTFYHFFKSKEDFVCQLIEYQREKFWHFVEILKAGKDKMSEENGKRLLHGIIFNEDSVYQYLSLSDSEKIYAKENLTPNLEREAATLYMLFASIDNVKENLNYGVISNLLKIMAMAAGGKKYLHESKYNETQEKILALLYTEIFNMS